MNDFTVDDGDCTWVALAQNGRPARVGDLHAVTAIRKAGSTGMRRAAIDINIFLIVKDILVHFGAGAVGGKDRAGKRRIGTKITTKCQDSDKGDPYTFLICFHLIFLSILVWGAFPRLVQDGFVLVGSSNRDHDRSGRC